MNITKEDKIRALKYWKSYFSRPSGQAFVPELDNARNVLMNVLENSIVEDTVIRDYPEEIMKILEKLLPLELVSGDVVQRTNPHSRQMCNINVSWAVTQPTRSARETRASIEKLNKLVEEHKTTGE